MMDVFELLMAKKLGGGTGSGGSGGVSSWNDLTDKPFYDETVDHGPTITWDGNTEGLPMVSLYEEGMYYKRAYLVSEGVPSAISEQDVVITTVNRVNNDFNEYEHTLKFEGQSLTDDRYWIIITLEDNVYYEADWLSKEGLTFPKKGVWLIDSFMASGMGFAGYTASVTLSEGSFIEEKVKTIPKEYLPADIGGGAFMVNVYDLEEHPTEVGAMTFKTDKTFEEIEDAVKSGCNVIAIMTDSFEREETITLVPFTEHYILHPSSGGHYSSSILFECTRFDGIMLSSLNLFMQKTAGPDEETEYYNAFGYRNCEIQQN